MKRSLLRNEIKKTRRSNWFFFQANFVSYRLVHQQIYSYWLLRLHAPKRLNYFSSCTIINIGIVYAHIISGFWTMSKVTKWMLYQSKLSHFLYSLAQSSLIYKKLVTSPHSTQTHPPSLSLNNISTYHQKEKRKKKTPQKKRYQN